MIEVWEFGSRFTTETPRHRGSTEVYRSSGISGVLRQGCRPARDEGWRRGCGPACRGRPRWLRHSRSRWGFQHDAREIGIVHRFRGLADREGTQPVVRPDTADGAVADRRVFEFLHDLARLICSVHMRDDDAERAVVQDACGQRVFAVEDADDVRDAGVQRGDRHLRGLVEREHAMLAIQPEPVVAGGLGHGGDLHGAQHADRKADRHAACCQFVAG